MKLSYEDALFYNLLLQTGFYDEVNKWIDDISITHDKLEDVYLDLVCYQNDINKISSILHNYLGNNLVDVKSICDRLRIFFYNKFNTNEISIKEVALSLYHLSRIDDRQFSKYWHDFYILGEYYYSVEERIVDPNTFYSIFTNYLQTGQPINTDRIFNGKQLSFKDIMLQEKKEMNPIRFKCNYIVVPLFLCVFIILITLICVFMSIDEDKYTPLAIVFFSIIGIMIIALLISVPLVRKKEIEIELQKYDFTIEDIEKSQYIIKSNDGTDCIFNKTGIIINNVNYKYDDFDINLYTTNYLIKVNISIEFILKRETDIELYWNFKLNKDLLNSIIKYNIDLTNKDLLNYIINNKEQSFKQIITYGYVKTYNR